MIGKQIRQHRATLIEFAKFAAVGALGFVLDNALVYTGIDALGLGHIAAGLFSFPFVVTFTWLGNRFYTFRASKAKGRDAMRRQWIRFVAVCAIGLVFNRGTYSLLVSCVPVVFAYPTLGLLAGTAAGMFFNFFASKRLVFQASR